MTRVPERCVVRMVRHAESEGNADGLMVGRSDPDLSRRGLIEASAVAERLDRAIEGDAFLVSSPKKRAVRTAEVIARSLGGVPLHTDERLEELDFGELEGVPFQDLLAAWPPDWVTDPKTPCPGGESYDELLDRVRLSVHEWMGIATSEGMGNLVVVTHLGPVKAMVADTLGGHWEAFERVIVGHASVSTLEIGSEFARLVDLNLAPRRASR